MVASSPYLLRGQGACGGEAVEQGVEEAPTQQPVVVVQGEALGTTWTVQVVEREGAPPPEATVRALVNEQLAQVDVQMSTWRKDSELSRFNALASTEPMELSPEHAEVIRAAVQVFEASGGAFDVTVRPLVRRWGFGSGGDAAGAPPDEAELTELRAYVGSEHLSLEGTSLSKDDPRVEVDLSAIAKGFAVDRVSDALEAAGYLHHMVEVGGEVQARGRNRHDLPWRIAVEKPDASLLAREIEEVVPLEDMAMATSGDYRDYREVDGVRISHTIDARTGAPIRHGLASVTVLHKRCAQADAWATALNVLGPEEGMEIAEREGLAALLLVRKADGTFEHRATTAFTAHLAAQPSPQPG